MTKKQLRELRESIGLTQQQFADLVGMSLSSISSMESGGLSRETGRRRIRDYNAKIFRQAAEDFKGASRD